MSDDIADHKRALRAELRERRQLLTPLQHTAAEAGITEQLRELVAQTGASSLSCYLSSRTEPPTRAFLRWATAAGIRVLLPITRSDGLLDWFNPSPDSAEPEQFFGQPESEDALLGPIAVNDVDLMIVPAAAIDHTGMRLGWGRGFFDKTLSSMERRPPAYAVVYDTELVAQVPRESHDQAVTGVVTPTRTLTLNDARR